MGYCGECQHWKHNPGPDGLKTSDSRQYASWMHYVCTAAKTGRFYKKSH